MIPPDKETTPRTAAVPQARDNAAEDEVLDFGDLFRRLARGIPQILGLALLGLAVATLVVLTLSPTLPTATSARVVFSFDGIGRGQYPDKSKFQSDDLIAPDLVAEALNRQKLDSSEEFQSVIRGALTVEGVIPPNVIRERDRLRANGQTIPPYIPDEFLVTLSLPRKFELSNRQREQFLGELVGAYREKFLQTYGSLPVGFGNAFESLKGADYFEYELVLNSEIQRVRSYLTEERETARSFRSKTTNLSFGDLINQSDLFAQIRLNETLGLIRQNGVSINRELAMVKMDYYLETLEDRESKALEEEKVIQDLLLKAQEHSENYVLGIKSQAVQPRPETPILDQGLIDSLLANDAYGFLVRQALAAGMSLKEIQSEKAMLLERKKAMQAFISNAPATGAGAVADVQKSLDKLQVAYADLMNNVRKTSEDFEKQRFADAVVLSMQPRTEGFYRPAETAGIVGILLGLAAGTGLSLLGIYVGKKSP
jgi:hypothetical protein